VARHRAAIHKVPLRNQYNGQDAFSKTQNAFSKRPNLFGKRSRRDQICSKSRPGALSRDKRRQKKKKPPKKYFFCVSLVTTRDTTPTTRTRSHHKKQHGLADTRRHPHVSCRTPRRKRLRHFRCVRIGSEHSCPLQRSFFFCSSLETLQKCLNRNAPLLLTNARFRSCTRRVTKTRWRVLSTPPPLTFTTRQHPCPFVRTAGAVRTVTPLSSDSPVDGASHSCPLQRTFFFCSSLP
jgi:hypothetical protein